LVVFTGGRVVAVSIFIVSVVEESTFSEVLSLQRTSTKLAITNKQASKRDSLGFGAIIFSSLGRKSTITIQKCQRIKL